nr:Uncharacterised protein [Streptococcus thermophilus]
MGTSPTLFVVNLPDDARARRDFQWARKHSVLGFTSRFRDQPEVGDILMLCTGVKVGKRKAVGHVLLAAVLSAPFHPDKEIPPVNLSWPSEVEERKRKYIRRVPVSFFAEQQDNDATTLAPLFDALRRSGKNATPRQVDASPEELDTVATNFGFESWAELERGKSFPFGAIDPLVTRAEDMTRAHYESEGWCVIHVGHPHNFLCRKGGEEKRVTVKASAAATIRLAPSELASARQQTTDLVVISPDGGMRILPDWHPLDADLTASEFDYRLPEG